MLRVAAVLALLVVLAAPVHAQGTFLDLTVKAPTQPLPDGIPGQVRLTIERGCTNPSQVLPESEVAIRFTGPEGFIATGPTSVSFPQLVCATGGTQARDSEHDIYLPNDTRPLLSIVFQVTVSASGGTPVAQPPSDAQQTFVLSRAEPAPAGAEVAAVEQESPSPAAALLGLGLLAAVLVARRRA